MLGLRTPCCLAPPPAGWLMGREPRREEEGEGTPSFLFARSSGWHRSSGGGGDDKLHQPLSKFLIYPIPLPAENQPQGPLGKASTSRHKSLLRGWGPGSTRGCFCQALGSDVFTLCSPLLQGSNCFRQSPLLGQREWSPSCVFSSPVLLKKKNSDKMSACDFCCPT